MISMGVDGLSRSDFSSGVMAGKKLLSFLPFNESAFDRQKNLLSVTLSWLPDPKKWTSTTFEHWFDDIFTQRDSNGKFSAHEANWIWSPPPCLARVAVEQLCECKHVFPETKHVFICPALMTGYWRKMLGKISDVMFTVNAGPFLWHVNQHEPLTIAFIRPLLSTSPWKASRLRSVADWRSSLSSVHWENRGDVRNHMRKFWDLQDWN